MHRHRIKLLITLVLFTVVLIAAGTAMRADARGFSPGASSALSIAKPGATLAAGDPDAGQGYTVPPSVPKKIQRTPGGLPATWIGWASRIWVTLILKVAR